MNYGVVESTAYIMNIIDLQLIPEEISMNNVIFKATEISILKNRIKGIINNDNQNHFDFDLKHWMQWASNFNKLNKA